MSTSLLTNQFVTMQLSFSTADIEKSVFFSPELEPISSDQPIEDVFFLVVDGELFALEDEIPPQSIPLTEKSGLFKLSSPE